ncbi:hypothetical protein BPOR_0158g00050 [Botrytis porri]|uniref:Uncharacterized protein n=1 Tax=Botrytis porri TaxID=87229 RepID=A0A4Z1KVE9_9HELO|nr:hypothetical protein BPOR_0158g00050 [Botrytis porri]
MVVLKIENLQSGSGELEFTCQQWKLGTHRPKLTVSQELNASRMNWCLYDHPVSQRALGRPIPVSLTPDLQYLRIDSQLFAKQNGEYTPINLAKGKEQAVTRASKSPATTIEKSQSSRSSSSSSNSSMLSLVFEDDIDIGKHKHENY